MKNFPNKILPKDKIPDISSRMVENGLEVKLLPRNIIKTTLFSFRATSGYSVRSMIR